MGFRDRLKNMLVDEPPPPPVANPVPTAFGERLGDFGAYDSKAQFMIDWAASIFREAGQNPSEHLDGIRDMANIACFTQIWFRLRNVADGNGDRRTAAYLDSVDRQALLPVVDTVYPTAIEMSGRSGGMQDGPMMANFKSQMDRTFDDTFRACRAEFIEGVHKGDF